MKVKKLARLTGDGLPGRTTKRSKAPTVYHSGAGRETAALRRETGSAEAARGIGKLSPAGGGRTAGASGTAQGAPVQRLSGAGTRSTALEAARWKLSGGQAGGERRTGTAERQAEAQPAAQAAMGIRAAGNRQPDAFTNHLAEENTAPAAVTARGGGEAYALLQKLPEGFLDGWSGRNTEQQRRALAGTQLTPQEQWLLLNEEPRYVETLGEIQELRGDRRGSGLRAGEAEDVYEELLALTDARIGAETASNPETWLPPATRRTFYAMLDERKAALLEALGMDDDAGYTGRGTDGWPTPSLQNTPASPKPGPSPELDGRRGNQASGYAFPVAPGPTPYPFPEKKEAYIFYTNYVDEDTNADFTKQAEYQKQKMENAGYTVHLICTNEVEAFQEEWKGMSNAVDTAVIISHCNGMSLIFGDAEDTDNAISATGRNRDGDRIAAISDLEAKDIDKLYLLACNAGHKELLAKMGTNVGDAFRDLGSIDVVYAYDGSVGFGLPLFSELLGYWPRLAMDQSSYYNMHETFKYEDAPINPPPAGLLEYRREE